MIEHPYSIEARRLADREFHGDIGRAFGVVARQYPDLLHDYLRSQGLDDAGVQAVGQGWLTAAAGAGPDLKAHQHPFFTRSRALADAEHSGDLVKASQVLANREPKLYDDYVEFLRTGETQMPAAAATAAFSEPGLLLVAAKDVVFCRGGFDMAPIMG